MLKKIVEQKKQIDIKIILISYSSIIYQQTNSLSLLLYLSQVLLYLYTCCKKRVKMIE